MISNNLFNFFEYTFSNNSLEKLVNRQLATNQLMPIVSQVKRSMDYQQVSFSFIVDAEKSSAKNQIILSDGILSR